MNPRTIIFSGIMTALIGAMIGLAVYHISQRETRKSIIVISGAVVGFTIGSFMASIQQEKQQRDREFGDSDKEE
jgi:ABC-type multidrug transport system permease subunit